MIIIRALLHTLNRRWGLGLLVLAVLLGIGAASLVTVVMRPTYAASTTLYVVAPVGPNDSDSAYESGLLAEQRMKSYVELAKSERISQDVVTQLGLNTTADELASRVTASSVAGTLVLTLSATDSDPARAAQITNAVAASLSTLIGQLEPRQGSTEPVITTQTVLQASPPTERERPNRRINLLIGAIVGLGLGVGATVLRRRYDTSVQSPDELAAVMGAPILGVIAPVRRSAQPLAVLRDPTSDAAEGYRRIRTNLKYLDGHERHRVIMVTSPDRGDGRTTTLCNLAIAVALTGRRVLVVDADLRHPEVARVLGLKEGVGLADVLVGNIDLQGALQPWGDGVLDVLPSGAIEGNPGDLLDSPSMVGLLDSVRQRYDLVLVDAPALLQVTDAAALAPQVDGSILVAHWGRTKREHIRAAREALDVVSAQVLGVVMTRVPGAVAYEQSGAREPGAYDIPERMGRPVALGVERRTVPVPSARSLVPSDAQSAAPIQDASPPAAAAPPIPRQKSDGRDPDLESSQ